MNDDAQQGIAEPQRSQPSMPQGYLKPADEGAMLAWSDIDQKLAAARIYWLGTASKDGDPHATPIWGAWVAGKVYFDGYYEKTRWGRNLLENPRIVVHVESGNYAIMLKGVMEVVTVDPDTFKQVADSFAAKYNGYRPETSEGMCSVQPQMAFAWDNENFQPTATRWRFTEA